MSLLQVNQLSHTYAQKQLYQNASFAVYKGEHVGVVGSNGVGKSTLLRILLGEVIPDTGDIVWQPSIRIGHMDQYALIDQNLSIYAYLCTTYQHLYDIEEEMQSLYALSAKQESTAYLHKAANLQSQLLLHDFYTIDTKIAKISTGLGIHALGIDRPIATLSGGQRAKVILAKLLLDTVDFLLLDEPTNFLDHSHIDWLAEYLAAYENAFLVVSHDADFIARISNCILLIEATSLKKYHSSYEAFLVQKENDKNSYDKQYIAQQKHIAKTEEFIRRNIAGVNTKMAQGRRTQLAKLTRMAAPHIKRKPRFCFIAARFSQEIVLRIVDLAIGYEHPLLPRLSLEIRNRQKLVITGCNGIGKSTLMKTIQKELPALHGYVQLAEDIQIAYYDQSLYWPFPALTALQLLSEEQPLMTLQERRFALSQCGIDTKHVEQSIATLSGGEQAKVKLCLLMLQKANCLLFDEPTNHLDQDAKDALQQALIQYDGTVILISHDPSFYQGFADKLISFDDMLQE